MAYAWTDIRNGDQVIKAGDSVSESDFDSDDWDQLVDSRSVRNQRFPDLPADWSGSPREFMIKNLNEQLEATEEMLSDDDVVAVEREVDLAVEPEGNEVEDEE